MGLGSIADFATSKRQQDGAGGLGRGALKSKSVKLNLRPVARFSPACLVADHRPGDARRGAFDVVVVWRFDRFARSVKQLVEALEEFRSLNIDFVSHQEALDTSTPKGKAMFTIVAAMAELVTSPSTSRQLGNGVPPGNKKLIAEMTEPSLNLHDFSTPRQR